MEELVELPGVGRKTANLMRGQAFGMPAIVVDTHVKRIAGRLGLSENSDADKIEQDLQEVLPEGQWWPGSSRLLPHGRYVCKAKKPACGNCQLAELCPSRQ